MTTSPSSGPPEGRPTGWFTALSEEDKDLMHRVYQVFQSVPATSLHGLKAGIAHWDDAPRPTSTGDEE